MAYCVLLINGAPMRGLRAIPILIVLASAALIQGSVPRNLPRDAAPAPDATHGAEAPTWTPVTDQKLSHGRFENFTVYSPHAAPRGFVLLLSGADGWNQEMSGIAQRLGRQGAMVAGIDVAQLDASLEADGAECVFPDG